MAAVLHCFGALALEVAAPPALDALDREQAEALAGHVAIDLQRMLPGVPRLDLAMVAAHFDPTELLRPRWPLHAALSDLAQRAPGQGRGRVIAFGAVDGRLPAPVLQPDAALAGGPLRLLPFALLGEPAIVSEVGEAMESRLLETGMAGAATALFAQQAFGGKLEHARYLSLHDLCAMTAMQYEHAGLAALWPLIEVALLAPESALVVDQPPEPRMRIDAGVVRIEHPDLARWREQGRAPVGADETAAARAHARFGQRIAQFRAVLEAHGIASSLD